MRAPSWGELVALLIDARGGDRRRGVIRSSRSHGQPGNGMGWMSVADRRGRMERPVSAGGGGPVESDDDQLLRCWQDGERVRIEDADGRLHLMTDGDAVWSFDEPGDPPVRSSAASQVLRGSGTHLLSHRAFEELLAGGPLRPTGPTRATTAAGRSAWEVELARPSPLQLVVDAATGMLLQQRCDALGAVDEWIELTLDEPSRRRSARGPSPPAWPASPARRSPGGCSGTVTTSTAGAPTDGTGR